VWLLAELFDPDHPQLVLFFDDAHLLFAAPRSDIPAAV
jgi:hypothetical protein